MTTLARRRLSRLAKNPIRELLTSGGTRPGTGSYQLLVKPALKVAMRSAKRPWWAERASCRRLRSPGSKPTKKRLAKERRPGCLPSKTSFPRLSTLSRWPGGRLRPLPREEEAFLRSATDDAGRRKAGKPAATMGPSGSTTSPSPSVTRHTGELAYSRSTRSTPTPGVRG